MNVTLKTLGSIFLIILIIIAIVSLNRSLNQDKKIVNTQPTSTVFSLGSSSYRNTDTEKKVGQTILSGKTFTANKGDVVSGDICIVKDNKTKQAIYDNLENTADIVIFNKKTVVYAQWGCYLVRQASQTEINSLIQNKKNSGYTVRKLSR